MNICKGCGEARKLIDAHIIPKSFFLAMNESDGNLHQYSVDFPGRRKRRPIGFYDPNILCGDCDNGFSKADQYGAQTFLQRESEISETTRGGKKYYKLPKVDGIELRRFFAAILYRASITNEKMFQQISLGSTCEFAMGVANGTINPTIHNYAYLVSKYNPDKINKVIANPIAIRSDHMRFVRIFLPGYVAHVKTCSRDLPPQLLRTQTLELSELHMVGRNLRDLEVFEDFRNLAIRG